MLLTQILEVEFEFWKYMNTYKFNLSSLVTVTCWKIIKRLFFTFLYLHFTLSVSSIYRFNPCKKRKWNSISSQTYTRYRQKILDSHGSLTLWFGTRLGCVEDYSLFLYNVLCESVLLHLLYTYFTFDTVDSKKNAIIDVNQSCVTGMSS